ncbi:MAG: hypothetical protein NTY86_11950 [Deltaproteobacteria bacterium]|nr:hypothetical protein [Deltaproteobacteria bacterium]
MGIFRGVKPHNGAAVVASRKLPEVRGACAAASIIRSSGPISPADRKLS